MAAAEALELQEFIPASRAIGVPSMKQLRRLLPYFSPYRGRLAVGLVLVVVSTAISSVGPWLLSIGIDSMGRGASLAAPHP